MFHIDTQKCTRFQIKIDYESKLVRCVDWSKPSKWTKQYTRGMLLTQLFRLMHEDVGLSEDIFGIIVRKTEIDTVDVLTCIGLRYGKLQSKTVEELIHEVGIHKITVALLQSEQICSMDLVEEIIAVCKKNGIEDRTIFKVQCKLIPPILKHIGTFCCSDTILKMCVVSRKWYSIFMHESFLKKCVACQYQELLNKHVNKFGNERSSQWFYNQIKILKIGVEHCSILKTTNFPKFDQDSIQYLSTAKWHLNKIPNELKAIKVIGDDTHMTAKDAQEWPNIPLDKLTLSVGDKMRFFVKNPWLPDAQAKCYHDCQLSGTTLLQDISNPYVRYLCLDKCAVVGRPFCDHVWASKNIEEYTPNVTLNIVDTTDWHDLTLGLIHQKLYDKVVDKIIVSFQYIKIDRNLPFLFKALTDVTNTNKPKKISILVY